MRQSWILNLLLIATACAEQPPGAEPRVDEASGPEIELRAGQEVRLRGTQLRIVFLRVVDDSRCPRDVECVWAGNGAVEIGLTEARDSLRRFTVNTMTGSREVVLRDHRVTLVELNPAPLSTAPIRPEDYSVRLRIERVSASAR